MAFHPPKGIRRRFDFLIGSDQTEDEINTSHYQLSDYSVPTHKTPQNNSHYDYQNILYINMATQKIQDFPDKSTIGAAGEYQVLSMLLRNNYVAGKAPENTKDYDLVVLSKDGTKAFPMQVKTQFQNESKPKKKRWVLSEKHEKPRPNLYFALVSFSLDLKDTEIFLLDSGIIAEVTAMSSKIYSSFQTKKGEYRKESKTRIIETDYSSLVPTRLRNTNYNNLLAKNQLGFLETHGDGWMNPYLNAWHLLQL